MGSGEGVYIEAMVGREKDGVGEVQCCDGGSGKEDRSS